MLNNYLKTIFKQTIIQNAKINRAKFTTSVAAATETSDGQQQKSKPVPAGKELTKELVELPQFTQTESEQILLLINNNTTEQLLCYDISKARANKLHSWKTRNGPFNNIDDILHVEGFGLKVATKFYRSLLEPAASSVAAKQTKPVRVAPFIIPSLDEQQRRSINSCVAVRIGVSSVTWSRLALPDDELKPCLLTHWQHYELTDKKLHLNDLVQRCLYAVYQIPEADCYLFENPQMAQVSNNPGSVDQQNINIQKSQVTAILSYALAARNSNEVGNQLADDQSTSSSSPEKTKPTKCTVLYLRRFLTARLFNHLVGTERVSSENTVIKLMRTHYNLGAGAQDFNSDDYLLNEEKMLTKEKEEDHTNIKRPSFRENIDFPMELRKVFSNAERYQREFLGQSLLLNLAFVRLVLIQDPASIAAVTNRNSKIKTENMET